MIRIASLLIAATLACVSCSAHTNVATPLGTPSPSGSAAPSSSAAPADGTSSASTSQSAGARPSASASPLPTTVPGMKAAPLTVTIAATCVQPGGSQTLTITSTAGLQMSYGTQYADGGTHKEYGGVGTGVVPPGGKFTTTWVVGTSAPLGDARTDVLVAGKRNGKNEAAMRHPQWQIAKTC